MTQAQKNWHLIECNAPVEPRNHFGQKMVTKCRMQIQNRKFQCRHFTYLNINQVQYRFVMCVCIFDLEHGRIVYSRGCVAEAENVERDACLVRGLFPEVKILACETCQEDGCNESLIGKPAEIKAGDGNNSGTKTTYSMQLFSIVCGFMWLLF